MRLSELQQLAGKVPDIREPGEPQTTVFAKAHWVMNRLRVLRDISLMIDEVLDGQTTGTFTVKVERNQ